MAFTTLNDSAVEIVIHPNADYLPTEDATEMGESVETLNRIIKILVFKTVTRVEIYGTVKRVRP